MNNKLVRVLVTACALLSCMGGSAWSAIATITVTQTPSGPIAARSVVHFTAKAQDENGADVPGTVFTWASSDTSIGQVINGAFYAGCATGSFLGIISVTAKSGTSQLTQAVAIQIVPGSPYRVVVTANPATSVTPSVPMGSPLSYSAAVEDVCGNAIPGATVNWSVLYKQSGAVDQNGNFTAGTTAGLFPNDIVATSGLLRGYSGVAVTPAPPSSVQILVKGQAVPPSGLNMAAGSVTAITAQAYLGSSAIPGLTYSFSSSSSVGTMTTTGILIAGKLAGQNGTITAQPMYLGKALGTVQGSATVTVVPGNAALLKVSPTPVTMKTGDQQAFTATLTDIYGNPLSSPQVTWSMLNPRAGTIDSTGNFTAGGAAGTYPNAVMAVSGTARGFAAVTVTPTPPTSVQIFAKGEAVPTGGLDVGAGTVTVFTAKAFVGLIEVPGLTYTFSTSDSIGTLSAAGVLLAGKTAGATGTITAQPLYLGKPLGSVTGSAKVTIVAGNAALLKVAPTPVTMKTGDQQAFTATLTDIYGNPLSSPQVTWSMLNPRAGTIDSTGNFTAGGAAGTYPNAVMAVSGTARGFAAVTVTPTPPTSVQIFAKGEAVPTGGLDVGAGTVTVFTAKAFVGLIEVPGLTYTFSTSDSIGTLSAAGVLLAGKVAGANGTITAQPMYLGKPLGSVTGSAKITIVAGNAALLKVAPTPVTMKTGDQQAFTATLTDIYGNPLSSPQVTWSMLNPRAGTIDSTGNFTAGGAAGTYPNAVMAVSGTARGFAAVTVTPTPPTSVQILAKGVAVPSGGLNVGAGTVTVFTAKAFVGLIEVPGLTYTFSTSGSLGTLTATGVLMAGKTAGANGTITAQPLYLGKPLGSVTGSAKVTIVAGNAALLKVAPTPVTMKTGDQQAFTATLTDIYGNPLSSPQVTWSMLNPRAGTIDSTGNFTAGGAAGTYPNAVMAVSGTARGFATVTVTPTPPTSVQIFAKGVAVPGTGLDVGAGTVTVFTAKAFVGLIEVPGLTYTFSTSDSIGTLSAAGVLLAGKTAGAAGTITAQPMYLGKSLGAVQGNAQVTITAGPPVLLKVMPSPVSLKSGQQAALQASATDLYGNAVSTAKVTWSMLNPAAGTIASDGTFTAGGKVSSYPNAIIARSTTGPAYAFDTVNVLDMTAAERIPSILASDNPTVSWSTELTWYTNYLKQNPNDNAGILGYAISRAAAATNQVITKDALSDATLVRAISFQRSVKMLTDGVIPNVDDIPFNLVLGRTMLAQQITSASTLSVSPGTRSPAAVTSAYLVGLDLQTVVIPALQDSIARLGPLVGTSGVIASYTNVSGQTVNVRSDEVQAYRAGLEAVLAYAGTQVAYSWQDSGFNWARTARQMDLNKDSILTTNEYLPGGTFLTLTNRTLLNQSWTAANDALADASAVAGHMATPVDTSQLLALIIPVDWSSNASAIAQAQTGLTTPAPVSFQYNDPTSGNSVQVNVTENPQVIWQNPVTDLKPVLPSYNILGPATGATSLQIRTIPDETMHGLFPNGSTEIPAALWAEWFNVDASQSSGGGTPPNAPSGLQVNRDSVWFSRFNLSWTASTTPGITTYRIYRKLQTDQNFILLSPTASTTTYQDTSVPAGSAFDQIQYYVTAVDSTGLESNASNVVVVPSSGGPPPPPF